MVGMLSTAMRTEIVQRIVRVAARLADTRVSFDEFVQDVTDTHLQMLEARKSLESVKDLLLRSGHESSANRLTEVQEGIDASLDVLRKLDNMYHSGKLRYGPRAPKIRGLNRPTSEMMLWQEKPSPSRESRINSKF